VLKIATTHSRRDENKKEVAGAGGVPSLSFPHPSPLVDFRPSGLLFQVLGLI
jgi:hypothetical protein